MRRLASCISLILLLLAAACGDDGGETAAGGGSPAAEPTAEEATGEPTGEATEEAEPSATATAAAAADCSMLEGETISFVVPYDPGGGYDSYARMIGPALQEEIGATVVVENQPGAGGLLAINSLMTAPTDGTTIAIMNGVGTGGAAISGAEGVQFELQDLSYLARVVEDRSVLVTAADSEFQDFQQVLDAEQIRLGSNGPGAQDYITAVVMNALFDDLDAQIITGFDGSEEVALTLLQGEIDVMSGSVSSRLPGIEAGDERPLLVMSPEPSEELPDTPTLLDQELDEEQQALADAYLSLMALGRDIVAPPGLPEDVLSCLRGATEAALTDPALLEEAEQLERPIEFLSGEELDELVSTVVEAPERFVEVITEAHAGQ